MPSSQKTNFANLNLWSGTDKPKRADWNDDNAKLDSVIQSIYQQHDNHKNSSTLHVTAADKSRWNEGKAFKTYTYTGNGAAAANINLGQKPTFAIVFAVNKPPVASTPIIKSYSGFLATSGCSEGLALTANGFTAYQQATPGPGGGSVNLNESGIVYICTYW